MSWVLLTATYAQLDSVDIYMRLAAGSPSINMDNVVISVTDGGDTVVFAKAAAASATDYAAAQTLVVSSVEALGYQRG